MSIPLLDAIKQVPRYTKFLKELCTSKKKLKGNKKGKCGRKHLNSPTKKTLNLLEQAQEETSMKKRSDILDSELKEQFQPFTLLFFVLFSLRTMLSLSVGGRLLVEEECFCFLVFVLLLGLLVLFYYLVCHFHFLFESCNQLSNCCNKN